MVVSDAVPRSDPKTSMISIDYGWKGVSDMARFPLRVCPESAGASAEIRDNSRSIRAISRWKVARDSRTELSTISSISICKFRRLRAEGRS